MPSSPVGVCVKECDFILSGMCGLYFSRKGCPPAQKTQLDSDLGTDSLVPIAPSSLLGEEGHATESSWEKEEGQFLPGIAVEEGCQQLSLSIAGEHGAAVEPWTRHGLSQEQRGRTVRTPSVCLGRQKQRSFLF